MVAGEHADETRAIGVELQHATRGVGLTSILAGRDREGVDLELGGERPAPLLIYDHGRVDPDEVGALSPPETVGPDLLLWSWNSPSPPGPHALYLLGMHIWSLFPGQVRCLLPPSTGDDLALRELRRSIPWVLTRAGVHQSVELLRRPAPWRTPRTRRLFHQIVQSLLSCPRHRRGGRSGRLRRAAARALGVLLVVAGSGSVVRAQPESAVRQLAVVEVRGLGGEEARVLRAEGGAELYVGPYHLGRVQPGVGAWASEEDALTLSSRREEVSLELDGEPLAWGSGEHSIGELLVIHAPEYSFAVRRGRVDMRPDLVVVRAQVRTPPFSGRTGLFAALVLAGVILLLMWRATSVQRRLDQPRSSVRRRRPGRGAS